MLNLFDFFLKLPSLKALQLKRYEFDFSLKRLVAGVDNIHLDVHISPQVQNILKETVFLLMIRHSRSEIFAGDYQKGRWEKEKEILKQACTDVLLDGINRAKSESEVQIDFLGQVSLAKLFLIEVENQYGKLISHFENLIRTYELSHQHDQFECFSIKEKLSEIKHNRKRILRLVREDLFHVLADASVNNLQDIRESNFPREQILPDNFFVSPMLFGEPDGDDFFLLQEYELFSQRAEDPDNYNSLKMIVYDLLRKTDLANENLGNTDRPGGNDSREDPEEAVSSAEGKALDPLIMEAENFDRMFNCFDSRDRYQTARRRKDAANILGELKSRIKIQERLLTLFYRKFKQLKLIKRVVAAHEIKSVYENYCPPLVPWQVLEFMIRRGSRKPIARRLKRLKRFYGKTFSFAPLYKAIRRVERSSVAEKQRHLLTYLMNFLRYHRDLTNYRLLKEALDAITLVTQENILLLSRENRSLYELLLPGERVKEDKPIINHVIVKADIRGSTDITYLMRARGLNPASYFSLNFFDPISGILFDYGGSKEFTEGDAIILSLVEYEETPDGWYSVARACGLAVRMLSIVQQYNVKSQKHNLPVLELGIGICYDQKPPAFLFDGDSRIMISPAINLADRLSGCDKTLRRRLRDESRMFNLAVFQNTPAEDIESTKDDLFLRYNVNGIELNTEGFEKLSREINLKGVLYPANDNEKVTLYTGKVPTLTGQFERLIIREAAILEVVPKTLQVIGKTSRKYYEVCTHPDIYEFVEKHA